MNQLTCKSIIISTSYLGNPISNYYESLADEFIKKGYNVIFIIDGLFRPGLQNSKNKSFVFWPSKRPTNFKDFLFLYKIIKKERVVLSISNFGATNVVSIVSFLMGVKNRINYVHTTSKQLTIDSEKSKIKSIFLKYRKIIIYRLNTKLLTNSNGNKLDIHSFYKIPLKKIDVIPLLINDSNIKYKNFDTRKKVISIVGRLHPSKGHKELIISFKNCLSKYPEIKLQVIGDGFLKSKLVDLVKKLEIENSVVFLGKVPNDKVGMYFSNSLISISSSLFEAYGLVNIESLREGTPLICIKTSGSIDIVKPFNNGVFFNFEEKDSLNDALDIIFKKWDFYSLNALNTFRESYSNKLINNHFNILNDILKL